MGRKKTLQKIQIFLVAAIILTGSIWGIKLYLREQNPGWQAAKEIYRVQTALQTVDEEWKLESLSEVHPYEITRPDGPSIFYYCCVTSYINEEPSDFSGLNKMALSQVVDVDELENAIICDVNGLESVMGEYEGKKYLCWTISPKYSCVLEYMDGTITEEDIFHIAESVEIPVE